MRFRRAPLVGLAGAALREMAAVGLVIGRTPASRARLAVWIDVSQVAPSQKGRDSPLTSCSGGEPHWELGGGRWRRRRGRRELSASATSSVMLLLLWWWCCWLFGGLKSCFLSILTRQQGLEAANSDSSADATMRWEAMAGCEGEMGIDGRMQNGHRSAASMTSRSRQCEIPKWQSRRLDVDA